MKKPVKRREDPAREELMERLINGDRQRRVYRARLKMALWEATIAFSYALKRILDLGVSLTLITLLSPVFLLAAIVIFIESPGPVIFKQTRVGKNGKHFTFYKFRSMVLNADQLLAELEKTNESLDGVIFKMRRDPRITWVGRWLRRFSVDELPQLFNVLMGDMSLVGPRPPLPSEVAQYTLEERKRLHVKPGITCFWQVSGRSDIPFKQQVELDKQYIQSSGFWTDIVVLLKTIPAVITGRGAY